MPQPNHRSSEPGPSKPPKVDLILTALRSRSGATIADLAAITGWQPHSIRAALTRLRQRGQAIDRTLNRSGNSRYKLRKAR